MSLQFLENDPMRDPSIPKTETILAEWGQLLEEATREVFLMMLDCEVVSEDARGGTAAPIGGVEAGHGTQPLIEVIFRQDALAEPNDAEVTAVVGIAGELCGVLNFACGTGAARMMAARMLGVEEDAVGDQQWDAIGEICNMVAGNFKAKLPNIGQRCMLSVPTIVVGSNYRLRAVAGRIRLEYRFRVKTAAARVILELQH